MPVLHVPNPFCDNVFRNLNRDIIHIHGSKIIKQKHTFATMDFISDLEWRGLLHGMVPDTENYLKSGMATAYIGFDPTSDSLHIGSLSQIITLMRFQRAGHKPIVLVGGATGMVGDPSGKSAERNLMDAETLKRNVEAVSQQLKGFLNFKEGSNAALLLNNADWMIKIPFIDFIRDTGKHLTVNYMMAKDSVKNRMEQGMSFTEFSYQLIQAYDFLYLFQQHQCALQIGGSDQWGNMTTGTELIRRKLSKSAYALTTPLITKQDGTKFGKTESGTIWLDAGKTSPYKFYQYWLNSSDADALKWIRYFTFLSPTEIESLEQQHAQQPALRPIQKALAKEVTLLVHGPNAYEQAQKASEVLFTNDWSVLETFDEALFLSLFEGLPQAEISEARFENLDVITLLTEATALMPGKNKVRQLIQGGGLRLNKHKIAADSFRVSEAGRIRKQYLIFQKGKKEFLLCKISENGPSAESTT